MAVRRRAARSPAGLPWTSPVAAGRVIGEADVRCRRAIGYAIAPQGRRGAVPRPMVDRRASDGAVRRPTAYEGSSARPGSGSSPVAIIRLPAARSVASRRHWNPLGIRRCSTEPLSTSYQIRRGGSPPLRLPNGMPAPDPQTDVGELERQVMGVSLELDLRQPHQPHPRENPRPRSRPLPARTWTSAPSRGVLPHSLRRDAHDGMASGAEGSD